MDKMVSDLKLRINGITDKVQYKIIFMLGIGYVNKYLSGISSESNKAEQKQTRRKWIFMR